MGRVDKADVTAQGAEGAEQAVGIAEQERAGYHMVAGAQQRDKSGGNGGHAGAETGGGDSILHLADFHFQGCGGGVALTAIDIAGDLAFEHLRQLPGVGIPERHREVHWLVHRKVLDRRFQIGMKDRRGKAVLHDRAPNKKPGQLARTGFFRRFS
jgi:hypothetical protein